MPRLFRTVAIALVVLSTTPMVAAMGFAGSVTQSTLGQRLSFVASVTLEPDESITPSCVVAELHAGEARIAPANVHVSLGPPSSSGQRDVRIDTSMAIDEPVVTIDLAIGCNSKMSRRFVAFIDPPALQLAATAPAEGSFDSPSKPAAQTAALADVALRADASRRGAKVKRGDASQRSASAERPVAARASMPNRHVARLQLDAPRIALRSRPQPQSQPQPAPPPLVAAQPASAPLPPPTAPAATETTVAVAATNPPQIPSAAAAGDPGASAPAQADPAERARMQLLETGLAQLRAESLATKKTIGALQARLHEAEGARYANGLVYALVGIALSLGLAIAGLLWLRPRQRRQARWFEAAANRHARTMRLAEHEAALAADMGPTAKRLSPEAIADVRRHRHDRPAGALPVTAPATIGGLDVTTVLGPMLTPPLQLQAEPDRDEATGNSGELSIEELIDLEQQAEFFVVLGQDDAAIALLDGYMRRDAGISPLPHLQLLEIHQRRGDRAAYESVRHAFNSRFQANAPEWSSDIHFGRALAEYPQTISQLQALWQTPLAAMQALDALLFRRESADETFDFPAYRELLFLYSIARELSGQVETDFGTVDVLLPLDDAPTTTISTLPGGLELAVDLDVSSWPPGATANELQMRRVAGGR